MSTRNRTDRSRHLAAGLRLLLGASVVTIALALGLLASPSGRGAPRGTPRVAVAGEVTGVASPCAGVTTVAGLAARPVRVALLQGTATVATETVTGTHRFLLAAPPGRYALTSNQYQRVHRVAIVLRDRQRLEVDLPVSCK